MPHQCMRTHLVLLALFVALVSVQSMDTVLSSRARGMEDSTTHGNNRTHAHSDPPPCVRVRSLK